MIKKIGMIKDSFFGKKIKMVKIGLLVNGEEKIINNGVMEFILLMLILKKIYGDHGEIQ
jgi:hypothetical protein